MATAEAIRVVLDNLRDYYRDKDGQKRPMSEFQIAVYLDGLHEFQADVLESAARQWMRQSRWFPALSDLRGLLTAPAVDWSTMALLAWTAFERAIGHAGIYSGATFQDAAIGETARQTFGTWEHACSYERDSPGWTIKRQTFIGLFPHVAQKLTSNAPVTMRGIASRDMPTIIAHVEGLPAPAQLALEEPDKSKDVLAEVTRRFKALTQPQKETA